MKRITVLIAAFVLILALAGSAAAYTYTTYDITAEQTKLIRNADGLYLIGYSGKDVQIERLAPSPAGAMLNLRYKVHDVGVFGDTIVALCADMDNRQLVVCTYDLDDDLLDSFVIGGADYPRGFCYDGSGIWIADDTNRSVMNRYSRTGRLIGSYQFPSTIAYLTDGYDCGFGVSDGVLYRIKGDSVTVTGGARVNTPLCCIGGGMLSDVRGRIYELNGDTLRLLYTLESGYECASACVSSGYIYYPVGDTVYQYELKSGIKRGWIEMDGTVAAMAADGRAICAVTNGGDTINRIDPSEFTLIQDQSQEHNQNQNQNQSHNQNQGQNKADNAQQDSVISSDVYRVDAAAGKITGISSPTTFAKFKSRMKYDGYTSRLYRNGSELKSGNVGTAMQVVFSNDQRSYTFELSVIGDLTGEGNVNSRDISDLMGYLLGTVSFNGVYTDAADLMADGTIDVADLALLCRMAEY